jgi:hypothetical protein
MKKIFNIFLVGALTLTACNEDVLDKQPLDIISDNVVWTDPSLVDAYLTQAYAQTYIFTLETPEVGIVAGKGLTNWNLGETGAGWGTIQFMSDECGNDPGFSVGWSRKIGGLDIKGGVLEWWENGYKVIRMCNELIERMSTVKRDASINNERIAEARFLRAFNYFALVKRYGAVPLITKAQMISDTKDELYPKRDSEQAVYDFIIKETDEMVNDLPVTASDYGRPDKSAALALKSRAALYAGSIAQFGTVQLNGLLGIDASKANDYYQKSLVASQAIMTGGQHSLYDHDADKVTNFQNIFLVKNNTEAIFVKRHNNVSTVWSSADGNGWSWDFFQSPPTTGWTYGNMNKPYLEMAEEFEHIDGTSGKLDRDAIQQGLWTAKQLWANKDPRFFASMYTHGTPWNNPANEDGDTVDWHKSLILPDGSSIINGSYNGVNARGHTSYPIYGTGFGILKYCDVKNDNLQDEWANSSTDFIVFRYGEVLLNYAEAAFELGKTSEALNAINQIRSRAGIAALTSIDRAKIHHERKVELAFEGHRYWDVRRWRTAATDLTRDFSGLEYGLDYNTRKLKIKVIDKIDGTPGPAFYHQNYYLPITVARTGQNPNLVENPGY